MRSIKAALVEVMLRCINDIAHGDGAVAALEAHRDVLVR